jgi:hypothetical protein
MVVNRIKIARGSKYAHSWMEKIANMIKEDNIPNFSQRNFTHFSEILLEGTGINLSNISNDVPNGHIQLQKNLPKNKVAIKIIKAGQKNRGTESVSTK